MQHRHLCWSPYFLLAPQLFPYFVSSRIATGSALISQRVQSHFRNVFYTLAIGNAFSFNKLSNISFFEHFLQTSHNLRISRGQKNISSEKT